MWGRIFSLQYPSHTIYTVRGYTHEWPEAAVGAAMILLAHCAFHVGQVRKIISQLEK